MDDGGARCPLYAERVDEGLLRKVGSCIARVAGIGCVGLSALVFEAWCTLVFGEAVSCDETAESSSINVVCKCAASCTGQSFSPFVSGRLELPAALLMTVPTLLIELAGR